VTPAKTPPDTSAPERAGNGSGPALMRVAVLIFAASLLYAVFTNRCLYNDGSYYFIAVLQKAGFVAVISYRACANYLIELPLVLALKAGIVSIPALRIAFGIGCFWVWPIAMAACYWLSPKQFWLVVLACGAGYLNAAFVAIGEDVVAHAFFWPVCFAILFARPLTPAAAIILLISSIILLCSYESMLFCGPPLALLALWRCYNSKEAIWQRMILLLSAALLCLAAYISVYGLLHPAQGPRLDSFRSDAYQEFLFPSWTVGWTAFWCLLMVCGMSLQIRKALTHPIGIAILGIIVFFWGAWPFLEPAHLEPWKQYEARFLNLAVPMALLPVACILAWRPQWLEPHRRYLIHFSAALLLAQSLWQIAATDQWRSYLNVWRGLMATHTGLVDLLDTPYGKYHAVGRQATQFCWIMDGRNLSIEISPPHVKSIIEPAVEIGGSLGDQFKPENFPHLERYGINFSECTNAILQNAKGK
jgi:hypothetical protein